VNILVIRLRLIGDVVFTTPILRALKRTFSQSRITYLVEREAAAVVSGNSHVDDVIVVPRTRGWARLVDDVRLARRLRAEHFDMVIDLHGGPRSSWLARATGAAERIGYDVAGRSWLYTRVVPRSRELRARHSVVNQWDILTAVPGWPGTAPDPARDPVEMPLDAAADRRVAERLLAAGVDRRHVLTVIHVSAGNPFRRWPEQGFVRLVTSLLSEHDTRRVVLSSGPSDREAADRIARAARERLGAAGDRILEFGDLPLAELRALVGRSRLFIGGDTGPLHVAATTNTPIVGIYGPTLVARSSPWRDPRVPTLAVQVDGLPCRPCDQRVCEPGDFRCLTTLPPEDVIAAAEGLLARPTVDASTPMADAS
jgi:lipopolysaccharide heptosyltransferase II